MIAVMGTMISEMRVGEGRDLSDHQTPVRVMDLWLKDVNSATSFPPRRIWGNQ
jgi:hypothetical protein